MTLSYKTALSLDGALAAQGTGPKTTLAHYTFRRQVIRLPNNNYMKKHVMYFLVLLLAALRVDAQSFQNLNFESATLSPTQGAQPWPDYVPIVSGLPDWTAYLGSVQQTQVSQNTFTLDTASIDILGPNWGSQPGSGGFSLGVIDGNYTVFLQTGVGPPVYTGGVNASIAQTGTVPSTAQSLQLEAWQYWGGSPLSVSFAGNNLPLVLLSSGQSPSGQQYDVYGADIAPYAGQTGQLEFTEVENGHDPSVLLDDISFSPSAVTPEPSLVALSAIGGLLFGARKWFARR